MTATILVFYDGSTSGDEGLRLACALAESENLPIEVVSVSIVPPSLPRGWLPTSFDEGTRMQLARARAVTRNSAVTVHTRVLRAYELTRAVMNECARVDPACVFLALDLSPSRWSLLHRPAILRQMLRNAPCPVYTSHAPRKDYPSSRHALIDVDRVLHGSPR